MFGILRISFELDGLILQVLMNVLATRGALEQGGCLDSLISIMLDSSPNQTVCCI